MNKLSAALAAGVCALGLSIPSTTHAVRMGEGGFEYQYQCNYGTVTVEGQSITTKVCWVEYYYVETSVYEYDFDSAYEWSVAGWKELDKHEVNWYASPLWVNSKGTKAWADNLSCDPATHDVNRGGVTSAANYAQTTFNGGRAYPVNEHKITLYMPNGYQQTFIKVSSFGSMQYDAVPGEAGKCKKPTTTA